MHESCPQLGTEEEKDARRGSNVTSKKIKTPTTTIINKVTSFFLGISTGVVFTLVEAKKKLIAIAMSNSRTDNRLM